jgi:hypothetical protein
MKQRELAAKMSETCSFENSAEKPLNIQIEVAKQLPELTRSKTPEKLLALFDPTPNEEIQKKIDYFFKPYSPKQEVTKFMRFEKNRSEKR